MTTFLYQPLFNILVLFYLYIPGHDFGVAVILLTVLIKLVLYPLGMMAIRSQKAMTKIQPKLKEIQEKYKQDKAKQTELLMELYKKEKVNPFASLVPILIQLPILWALYKVFWQGLHPEQMKFLYSFVHLSGVINPISFGVFDLSKPNIVFAIIAAGLQFWQAKMTMVKSTKKSNMLQNQMQIFFPFITLLILYNLPSALGLYWIVTTLFTIIQQYIVYKNEPTGDKKDN